MFNAGRKFEMPAEFMRINEEGQIPRELWSLHVDGQGRVVIPHCF